MEEHHVAAMTPVVDHMAAWIVGLRQAPIPDAVWQVATRATIDTVGVALAGSRTDVAGIARDFIRSNCGAGHATVWGEADGALPLRAAGAAFANGVAAHALDFDDNCYAGFVHASAVIVPAALAACQDANCDGTSYLRAYIAGAECQFAFAAALGRGVYDRGWWTTSLFGVVGACAAACFAYGLDEDATASALGLAIIGAGGTKAGFGSDAKALMVGRTAETGVMSALLARAGCQGPRRAIEAANGIAGLLNDGVLNRAVFETLGQSWRLLDPGIDIKRIPVCLSSHAAVDALRDIIAQDKAALAGPGSSIVRIVCDVPPIVVKNLVHDRPRTTQEAQFSMPFALAATVLHGDVTFPLPNAATLADDTFQQTMARVEMHSSARWHDPSLLDAAPEGAWVRVDFSNGTSVERFHGLPVGAAALPLTREQIQRKFADCTERLLGVSGASALRIALENVGDRASMRGLFSTA